MGTGLSPADTFLIKAGIKKAPPPIVPVKTTTTVAPVVTPVAKTTTVAKVAVTGAVVGAKVAVQQPVEQSKENTGITKFNEVISNLKTTAEAKVPPMVSQPISTPKQPSIIDQIISLPGNFISLLQTGYTILQNPKVQNTINEKIGRTLAPLINPEQFQLAYNVYSGTGESPDVIYERNYQAYKTLIEKKDIGGITGRVISSPFVVVGSSSVLGTGLGGFAATKIGQTAAFTIGKTAITPSLALNTGVGTIFGAGMAKSGYEATTSGNIKSFLGTTALTLPLFTVPFKAGYKAGGGYVQRTGAMSTLSDATQRTQQKAIYDMMKTTERLHEPYLESKPYDISQVKETPNLANLEQFMKSPVSTMIRKPAIGGSTAMDIQMGEFFRKGGYPKRVLEIARERQSQTIQPDMRNVPLKLSGTPGDIDILLGGKLATTKMAEKWGGELDTHVHVSKPGTEYWGGYSTKPFTKSFVSFTGEPVSVKTLSVREQFLRYGHSVLPSNIETKSYRAYKDVPGFYDTYDVLQFQKGGTKLNEAMDRFLNPEGYKALRVTIGEKFVKGIGGARKINEDWSYGSSKLGYVPSYKSTPTINNLLYRTDGYTKTNILSTSYVNKGFDYQPSYILKKDYKVYTPTPPPTYIPAIKTDYGYTPTKSTYTPSYEPPYTPPTYTPKYEPPYEPPYIPPTYVPDYKPPYTPPTYTPKYEPPYKPPPYKPPYYPDDKIPPPTNKIKYPSINMEKEIKESLKGYNVFIKERHYFKGKKKKPTSWFKASKYPLTKEQALALGSTAVNETAAASFKIVPTEGQPKNLGFSVDSWGNLSGNFYMKGNTFIEKTPYRINTQGEIKGISALGWLAQRQRPYQSPTKIRYTPTTNAKPMAIPKPISINININKIMRRWKL